nr:recombinase family protein [Nesterenkonia muleiensis]
MYLRISANRTSDHASIEQQRADCTTLAAQLGYTEVIEFVDEAVSAYHHRTRPQYQRLLDHVEHAPAATIIIWHMDRLYRQPRELEELLDLLDARPVRVESVQGGLFDLNRHEGRLFARQLVAFANYESAHKGARVARAHQQRAHRGLLHGGTHYGYHQNGSLHPDQSKILRRIIDHYLTGLAPTVIARELTATGIPAPADGPKWNATTITAILTSRRVHLRAGEHHGTWEPIITEEESALIRALQIAPRRDPARSSTTLLGGMAYCSTCDNRLVSGVTHRGQRIYRCRTHPTSCGQVTADMTQTDQAIITHLTALHPLRTERPPLRPPASILTTLTAATSALHETARQYGAATITRETFLTHRLRLISIIEASDIELHRHLQHRILQHYPDAPATMTSLSISRQRTIINALASKITIDPRRPGNDIKSRLQIHTRT